MNKLRLYQIIEVLTLPYCNEAFWKKNIDVIAEYRWNFFKLLNRWEVNKNEAQKRKERYQSSEKKLQCFISTQVATQSIDDYKLLIDFFYKEDESEEIFTQYKSYRLGGNEPNVMYILYWRNLIRVSRSLLTFRDGRIAIRMWENKKEANGEEDIFLGQNVFNKVEIWNLLSRFMPLDILIVLFMISNGLEEEYYLYRQNGMIFMGDTILETLLREGIAENHMHFNAAIQYQFIWQNYMQFDFWESIVQMEKEYMKVIKNNDLLFHAFFFRTLFAEYLEIREKEGSFTEFVESVFGKNDNVRQLFEDFLQGKAEYKDYIPACYKLLYQYWYRRNKRTEDDLFMGTIYYKYHKLCTYEEMIFLFKAVKYLEIREKKTNASYLNEIRLMMRYLQSKNSVFEEIFQRRSVSGLEYFQIRYKNMVFEENQMNKSTQYICSILLNSIHQNVFLKKYELRIAFPINFEREGEILEIEIKRKLFEYISIILMEYKKIIASAPETKVPNMGIIFSFVKKNLVDNKIGDMCWLRYDDTRSINKNVEHIILERKKMKKAVTVLEELRNEIPFLDRFIVGLDTASIENRAEPWIFAPIYQAVRRQTITRPVLQNGNSFYYVNNIGLTFHVGEEFRHILSGLRHIYEVINYMGYKAGDRIGHGIALGTNIEQWVDAHETVIIPVEEYLEDLLWLWGCCVSGEFNIQIQIEQITREIMNVALKVYGRNDTLKPDVLYDAYKEKFKLRHDIVFQKMRKYCDWSTDGITHSAEKKTEHFCKYYNARAVGDEYWTKDKLVCAYFCPVYYRRMQKPITVHIDKEKRRIYKEIQEKLMETVARKGIYVEVNPTSNTAIGDNKELFLHHVMNLNNHELIKEKEIEHEVMVSINSDDPLIFNTNCENELAYMYHALLEKGYSRERVIAWIEKIREYGINSSFVKEVRTREELCNEIDIIMQYGRKYLGITR